MSLDDQEQSGSGFFLMFHKKNKKDENLFKELKSGKYKNILCLEAVNLQ